MVVVSAKELMAYTTNRHQPKVLLLIIVFIFYLSWYFNFAFFDSNKYLSELPLGQLPALKEASKQHKTILLWNSPHRIEAAIFGIGHQAFIKAKCPVTNCEIVANSQTFLNEMQQSNFQLLKTFDAVLFSISELHMSSTPPAHYQKTAQQRFVFLTQESPKSMAFFQPEAFNKYFNWTMSYNRESDIQLLYGRFHSIVENGTNQIEGMFQRNRNKTKKVAWMVSHCSTHSKREEYVKELKKHIPVDIYGECGDFKCARNATHWLSQPECYVQLSNEYKFYLSFENSYCKDYVTEKFFSILKYDMVPIVLGAADYKSIAPPHSFIDTANFKTPAELAAYLLLLDGNDDLYKSYFDWKTQFSVEAGVEQMSRYAFCDLCAKLNDPKEPFKVYDSLIPQWSTNTQCNYSTRPIVA